MNGLLVAAALSAATIGGATAFVHGGRDEPPPRPFTGKNATLPGKIPAAPKSLKGDWGYQYQLQDAHLESGINGRAFFGAALFLKEDGTYEYQYHARWIVEPAIPTFPVIASLPGLPGMGTLELDGVNVTETGKFSLSGEILLLQPKKTERAEVDDNQMEEPKKLPNENRAYLVRIDKKKLLYVAGRCAKFQIDPVCKKATDVAYKFTSEVGPRWISMGR
jgi:hypothetical protein